MPRLFGINVLFFLSTDNTHLSPPTSFYLFVEGNNQHNKTHFDHQNLLIDVTLIPTSHLALHNCNYLSNRSVYRHNTCLYVCTRDWTDSCMWGVSCNLAKRYTDSDSMHTWSVVHQPIVPTASVHWRAQTWQTCRPVSSCKS